MDGVVVVQTAVPSMELPVSRLPLTNGLFYVEENWRVPLVLNSPPAIDEDMIIMTQLKNTTLIVQTTKPFYGLATKVSNRPVNLGLKKVWYSCD